MGKWSLRLGRSLTGPILLLWAGLEGYLASVQDGPFSCRSCFVLLANGIGQSVIVTKAFDGFTVFFPSHDLAPNVSFHLLNFRCAWIRIVVLPSGPKLAHVFSISIHFFFNVITDIDPYVFVAMVVVVIKEIVGDHVFVQAFLRNLPFEKQSPHGRARRVRREIRGGAMVGFVPALIV